MSNALAVAHVTQALALLIESNLRPEIDMAVSVETRKPPADPPTEPTITVFLYQVTHNPSMRNTDLPTRASDGTLVNRPVAALDLHYVISAYGEESELVGQRLIGCVARVMREFPVLPADVVEEAGRRPYLAGSDLASSAQKVRFTPLQMDIDETSKLWGMLHQTPYSLSMTYQGSLVLVEGREEPERSRPVERTEVRVGAGVPSADSPAGGGTPARGAGSPGVALTTDPADGHGHAPPAKGPDAEETPAEPAPARPASRKGTAKSTTAAKKSPAGKSPGQRAGSGKSAPARGAGRTGRGKARRPGGDQGSGGEASHDKES
ncbi:DUF4255 domain-containing protein [Streptomyces sp. HNM0574]|uniref:DUF4255 domain-containing protein n=1 Tax=Streptomyces sp. HNM0574 TaxID=2714954 RepID=UPI00146C13A5|nr:DUF4255 domain-containing protein [Streptomyces sp. HNM0574]NLU68205.1 DUF4255 domain-containing protein [Streptomyces sp. HNM0574]